jgi:hypothetical protein
MTDDQIRTEDGRLDVLNALYHRRTGAHQAETIRSVFLSNRGYALREVETWLADLKRYGYAEETHQGVAQAVQVWQITGAGITFKEKGAR